MFIKLIININSKITTENTVNIREIILVKLASIKTAYYVCLRIEQSLRKRRNPTPETNYIPKGELRSCLFQSYKSVFKVDLGKAKKLSIIP